MRILTRTQALGLLALGTAGVLGAVELRHVWRRGSARPSAQAGHYVEAGRAATHDAVAVIREGYHAGSARENAVFNMLVAFVATFGATRAVTHLIRTGAGPFGNIVIGNRHIHHFVPGILVGFAAGGVSIGVRREQLDKWLAVPFGAGVALVFDEAALLLELEDVYWSEEGILSVQITLGTVALLASLGLAVRLVRRGEPYILQPAAQADARPRA
jgi:hypothetical protein